MNFASVTSKSDYRDADVTTFAVINDRVLANVRGGPISFSTVGLICSPDTALLRPATYT
jgi:hypothetical protein